MSRKIVWLFFLVTSVQLLSGGENLMKRALPLEGWKCSRLQVAPHTKCRWVWVVWPYGAGVPWCRGAVVPPLWCHPSLSSAGASRRQTGATLATNNSDIKKK